MRRDPDPLARLVRPVSHPLRQVSVLTMMASLIWPVQAALVAMAFGGLLSGGPVGIGGLAAGYVTLGLVRAWLGMAADRRAQAAAESLIAGLRAEIVAGEATRGRARAVGGAGAIAALAAEKLEALAPWLTRYAPARLRVAVLPLVILALSFWFSWAAGLVLLISGPLIPVFMALVGLAARETSERQMARIGSLNDLLVDRLSALADIRVLGAGDAVARDFATQAGSLRRDTMAVLRLAFLSSTVLELFAAIGVAMMAVWVGFSLLGALSFGTWGAPLAPAAGIFLLLLAPDFYQPMRDLAAAWHDKAAADAVAGELMAWHEARAAPLPGMGERVAPLVGPASIALAGCRAAHGLRLPDMAIAPGEAVALVGPSGAGKTTVLRLMAGLDLPRDGEVRVARQVLTPEIADAWRARIGWMPQSVHFLNASLRANLTLGRAGEVTAALAASAAAEVVTRLPGGLTARLGETGGGLSGGEARRMTLARALHGAPDVILADEPTADLDAGTAGAVAEGLLAANRRGATLVVATHDMALASRMDRIIRLEGAA